MTREGYTSVSISNAIIEIIDKLVNSGDETYRTRSDFIKDALRLRLRDLGYIK
jgi:Arc/MetJ-type ribon-helix-helix transcriptional regulator